MDAKRRSILFASLPKLRWPLREHQRLHQRDNKKGEVDDSIVQDILSQVESQPEPSNSEQFSDLMKRIIKASEVQLIGATTSILLLFYLMIPYFTILFKLY